MQLLVCVVSVGHDYRPALERLAASLPVETGLSVLSDLPQGDLTGRHIFWHRLDLPAIHPIHKRFDWRLKAEALRCGFAAGAGNPALRYLYLDADCFFADRSLRVEDIAGPADVDIVTLRQRTRLVENTNFEYAAQMRDFIRTQGVPDLRAALAGARLPYEQAVLIQRLTPATRAFPDQWIRVAGISQAHGLHGDPDCVDIGLALELCGARYEVADRHARWLRAVHFTKSGGEFDLRQKNVSGQPTALRPVRPLLTAGLAVASGRCSPAPLQTMLADTDWGALIAGAGAERVSALLYKALKHETGVPQHVLHALRDGYRGTAARVAQLRTVLVEVLWALDAAGIPVVLLKGAALSVDVWTDIGLRPWSDIDLLIDQRHSAGAEQALAALGFERARMETTAGATVAHENELLLINRAGHMVDLHWSLFDSPYYQSRTGAAEVWRDTRDVHIEGAPARILTPDLLLLHLCGHLTLHHTGSELLWLNDVAEVVTRHQDQLDWDRVIAEAQRLNLVLALQRTVGDISATLAAPVPPEVLARIEALQPSPTERSVVLRLDDKERSMAARLWFDLTTMESWGARVAFVRTRLFPSAAYMRERYGVTSTVGLVLSYPYRWVIGFRRGSLG